jgi:two-component system sensor histidine kinase RegB
MVITPLEDLIHTALDTIHSVDRVELSVSEAAQSVLLLVPYRAVSQSVRALIKNALDASDDQGRVRVLGELSGDFVEVTVIDEGQGMDAEVLGRSGEPFFTTKEPGRGMGLGLFLTRTVVERLGGRLDLISQAGYGTRASFLLPIQTNDDGVVDV